MDYSLYKARMLDTDPEGAPRSRYDAGGPALRGASETAWTGREASDAWDRYVLAPTRESPLGRALDAAFGVPSRPTAFGRAMAGLEDAAQVSLMTYGASAARLGNARRLSSLLRSRPRIGNAALKRLTGYERGTFGLGVETRGDAALRPAAVFGAVRGGTLGELADIHPDVVRAYPGMAAVALHLVRDADWARALAMAKDGMSEWSKIGDTASGFSMRNGRGIAVRGPRPGESLPGFADRADRTLVHEMQHVAQDYDGIRPPYPHGTSGEYRTDAREVDARNSARRSSMEWPDRLEVTRDMTQDVKPGDVRLDDKGGDINGRHGTFRSFLATDEVPETIFGIPVVQGGYSEADAAFFKENPKAAGFYDLGDDEEMEEDVPQQAAGAGDTVDEATLTDDRPMYFFRDDGGKITGYGTTRSIVHEDNGRFFVIPTIIDNGDGTSRLVSDDEAVRHFRSTGEHWGGYADRWSAEDAADAVHERHQRLYGRRWNDYIQDHWDEMSDEIRSDPGVLDARHARTRGAYPGSLNNPGNVEKRKERRQGEVDSPHERWAKFATPQDGLREMADAIRQIAAVKLAENGQAFTVRNFAEVYAPRYNEKGEVENDTDKYIADISADSGFGPDEELHRFDGGDMARLLKSVVRFESGAPHSAWFTDEEYAEAARKLQEGAVD